jgi:hypothetical protein
LPFSRRHISTLITVIILCQVDPLSVPRVDQLVTETITGVVRQRRRKDFPSCFIRRHIGTVIISFSATEYHFRLLKADPEVSLSHLIGRSNGQWVQRVEFFATSSTIQDFPVPEEAAEFTTLACLRPSSRYTSGWSREEDLRHLL